jgi:hypothetical protein
VSVANLEIGLTEQERSGVALSIDPLTSSERTSRNKFAAGKALATASTANPERAVKREKRIVIKWRIGKLGVIGSSA